MKCPICGKGKLIKKTQVITMCGITFQNYITHKCNYCNEEIVDNDTLKETNEILKTRLGIKSGVCV